MGPVQDHVGPFMDKFHAAWPGREIHALEDLLFCNGRILFASTSAALRATAAFTI